MLILIRRFAWAFGFVLSLAASAACAEGFPSKAITIISPFAPGGAVDAMARLLAARLTASLQVPVVVKNVGGASGAIGMAEVARAQPDGYTLLYTPNTIAILPVLYSKLSFSPERDLVPVSQFISSALVIAANPKMKVHTLADLITLAKAEPGRINFGSSGVADPLQLGMEMVKLSAGVDMTPVPYKGQGPMTLALLSGEVDVAIVSLQASLASIRSGKLRALAVTDSKRSSALPDIPPVAATLPGYELTSWHGLFAPAHTPRDVVEKLQQAVMDAAHHPDVKRVIEDAGNEAVGSTSEAFRAKFSSDVEKFRKIVQQAHLPMQD
jgi:tripartite-type tricarboxylate transporter receptor subunit TctC